MIKILKSKKNILIILSLILFLILFFNYLKTIETTDHKLSEEKIISNKGPVDQKKIDQKDKKDKKEKEIEEKEIEEKEIESIALIKEIKDPFRAEAALKDKAEKVEENLSASKKINLNSKNDLIYLEKNIIADNLIDKTHNSGSANDSKLNLKQKSAAAEKQAANNTNEAAVNKNLKNIRLPFKLLGIIKNRDKSSALFFYQGKNLLKKEKEKIDIFKIEKINNKDLIISYQNQRKKLHLWEEKNNEN